ncbi:MAG: hypothetical protein IJY50_07140 [Clostridia bacterium]|nr:hypothetical protein [Clostridia bacterium]
MKTFLTINDLQENRFHVEGIANVLRPFGIDLAKQDHLTYVAVDEDNDKAFYTVLIDDKRDFCVLQFEKALREYWDVSNLGFDISIYPKSTIEMIAYRENKIFDDFQTKYSVLISIKTKSQNHIEIAETVLKETVSTLLKKFIKELRNDSIEEINQI